MKEKAPMQILVVKLGWVLVGEIVEETAAHITIAGAFCIRRWGTTKGLGQLAREGKQKETIMDPIGSVYIERDALLFRIDCNKEKWK